jgi:hypothetical protein
MVTECRAMSGLPLRWQLGQQQVRKNDATGIIKEFYCTHNPAFFNLFIVRSLTKDTT